MRYCIVAALHRMGDDGPWYTGEVQFQVDYIFNQNSTNVEWDDRSPFGKAFNRALESLMEDGTITRDDIDGYRLTVWDSD